MSSESSFKKADDKLQQVLEAVTACASGQASQDDVEAAVQSVLGSPPTSQQSNANLATSTRNRSNKRQRQIQVDTDDYDDEDDDTVEASSLLRLPARSKTTNHNRSKESASKEATSRLADPETYSHIPLGVAGAHMLTTFGAGRQPSPETVQAALQYTRTCLLNAIAQARQIRRRRKAQFKAAQKALKPDIFRSKHHTTIQEWSAEWQYRVVIPRDTVSYHPVGGFDLEDLQLVFPEPLNAFLQWNARLTEYKRQVEEEEAGEDGDDPDSTNNNNQVTPDMSNHLFERAAQFDQRTELMEEDWYLEFAQIVRSKGSFVPSLKQNQGLQCARFLHWMGIWDVENAKQPHPVVVNAVAFLAFDFLGRIIEGAVAWKTNEQASEIPEDERLEPADLEHAIQSNPELRELANVTNEDKRPKAPQLYFGPGFEYRVELEMEELLAASSSTGHFRSDPEDRREADREDAHKFSDLARQRPGMLPQDRASLPSSQKQRTKKPAKRQKRSEKKEPKNDNTKVSKDPGDNKDDYEYPGICDDSERRYPRRTRSTRES